MRTMRTMKTVALVILGVYVLVLASGCVVVGGGHGGGGYDDGSDALRRINREVTDQYLLHPEYYDMDLMEQRFQDGY